MQSVRELMLVDHGRIKDMLEEVEKSPKNKAKEKFEKFKWQVEKHFFAEEKAIFGVMDKININESSDIFDLMQEHGKILAMTISLEKKIEAEEEIDVSELKATIESHSDFENNVFYPKLDESLTENQKNEIIERAKEIIRG